MLFIARRLHWPAAVERVSFMTSPVYDVDTFATQPASETGGRVCMLLMYGEYTWALTASHIVATKETAKPANAPCNTVQYVVESGRASAK